MANKKSTKRNLILCVLAMIFSLAMMVGTTFAWFTDSVTSSGNIIASGTLDVTMEYKDKLSDANWKDASTNAIFNHENWEPGYKEVKYIKVANEGTLAFKYKINIYPNIVPTDGEVNLSDVIDVYLVDVADDGTQSVAKTDLVAANYINTMTEVMKSDEFIYDGQLESKKSNIVAIVLKMKETAGNEYMGLSAGDGFTVQLLATQLAYEEDSFDDKYDENAPYDKWEALPIAKVEKVPSLVGVKTTSDNGGATLGPITALSEFELETAYKFTAPKLGVGETVERTKYAEWNADFEVSIDTLAEANTVGLAGHYADFNGLDIGWVGFLSPVDVPANTPVRLIGSTFGVGFLKYKDLVEAVKEFTCGAWDVGYSLAGATLTVDLKLYEVDEATQDETGTEIVIGSYSFTFEDAPENAPVAEIEVLPLDASTKGIAIYDLSNLGSPTGETIDLEVAYNFEAPDDEVSVLTSPYKDWICDWVIYTDKDVAAGSAGLAGRYEAFSTDWFAFKAPTDLTANTPVRLLYDLAGAEFTYEDICTGVKSFQCGAFDVGGANAGTVLTVELRMYDPANPNSFISISKQQYTF